MGNAPQQSNEDGGGWWRAGGWTEEVEEAERPKHSKKGECFFSVSKGVKL